MKADTVLPIRLKTHQRMHRADKGQGTNGPITSWLLFRWWAHSGQEPDRPWSFSYPYEVTTKTHCNPAEPNTITKGVERWRTHRSCYTNDEGPVRQRTNSTGYKNLCQSQGEVMAGWHGIREVNLSIFGSVGSCQKIQESAKKSLLFSGCKHADYVVRWTRGFEFKDNRTTFE